MDIDSPTARPSETIVGQARRLPNRSMASAALALQPGGH